MGGPGGQQMPPGSGAAHMPAGAYAAHQAQQAAQQHPGGFAQFHAQAAMMQRMASMTPQQVRSCRWHRIALLLHLLLRLLPLLLTGNWQNIALAVRCPLVFPAAAPLGHGLLWPAL
jgi:ABC-type cobalamin transport system ATPase subunit